METARAAGPVGGERGSWQELAADTADVAESFPLKMMGTVIGGTAMAGSLGMATGPLFGGLLYDSFATYSWLYVASWGIGLGAFLIAMTFRPFPKAQTGAAVAA